MKRILIVEDEFLVRIGLKTTIDWAAHGYIIVGEASNGKEALQLFDEVNPDILITDVKMPVMDGLELLSEAKQRKKELQVIILSNYDNFEYAREAMHLDANQYLLKSEINEEGLLRALGSLVVAPTRSAVNAQKLRTAQEQYLRKLFDTALDTLSVHPKDMVAVRTIFPLETYIALRCDGDVAVTEETDIDSDMKNITSIIDSVVDDAVYHSGFTGGRLQILVVCPVTDSPEDAEERYKKKCELIVRNAQNYFDTALHIGISSVGSGQSITALFAQAEKARINCFFTNQSLCLFSKLEKRAEIPPPKISGKKLTILVDGGVQEELNAYVDQVFASLLELGSFSQVRTAFIDFVSIAKSMCEAKNIDLADGLSGVKFSYDNLMAMSCLKNVQSYIIDLYSAIFNAMGESGDRYSHTIRYCLEYIHCNYSENISLDNLSQAVDISKSYLSMIFKQEMGINFINYLNQYRIERAKELLLGTNLKIYEIADQVGFSSPYYFSKVFKDMTNFSCKEYKDRYAEAGRQ